MRGLVYRLGTALKDYGERMRCGIIVRIGIALRESV
jgi:hypothetical protein